MSYSQYSDMYKPARVYDDSYYDVSTLKAGLTRMDRKGVKYEYIRRNWVNRATDTAVKLPQYLNYAYEDLKAIPVSVAYPATLNKFKRNDIEWFQSRILSLPYAFMDQEDSDITIAPTYYTEIPSLGIFYKLTIVSSSSKTGYNKVPVSMPQSMISVSNLYTYPAKFGLPPEVILTGNEIDDDRKVAAMSVRYPYQRQDLAMQNLVSTGSGMITRVFINGNYAGIAKQLDNHVDSTISTDNFSVSELVKSTFKPLSPFTISYEPDYNFNNVKVGAAILWELKDGKYRALSYIDYNEYVFGGILD